MDFVIKEGLRVQRLLQVCWDPREGETRRREVRGLVKAMKEFELREGLVLTEDFEEEEEVKGKKILYRPVWSWLLAGP